MTYPDLVFVGNVTDIQRSLDTFNGHAPQFAALAESLLRTTTYWVYEPATQRFGPSKFVGFRQMTFPRYEAARAGEQRGANFNGSATRKAIERICGPYWPDADLPPQLLRWGRALLGNNVFDGIERNWRFVALTAAA